jgi:ribosomal protein S24E
MLKTLSLCIWLISHPVHVTLTSIDNVSGTDSIKVFVKMYYDDFLIDYRLFDEEVEVDDVSYDQLFPADKIKKYLDEKVNIFVNNKQLKGKLLNVAMTENEISVNLLYRSVKKPESITVRNLIMTSLYSDQANMTIIRINDLEEGVKLTPEKTEETFRLN